MKNSYANTYTSVETLFSIQISEELGWINPVYLLLSPNLKEVLQLEDEVKSLSQIKHFEIITLDDSCYLNFLNSNNNIINCDKLDLEIVKAQYIKKTTIENSSYSLFESYYSFEKASSHQEYCFLFVANNISYITSISIFSVED